MTLPTIDTHEFTRRGDAAEGSLPLDALERLCSMLTSAEGALAWKLSGRSEVGPDGSRSPFLHLALDGAVRMRCVRCLEPVDVPLRVRRDYRLVGTEAQAEREDADEDEVDLLVSSRRFDLASLVEDEAIMALPSAPRHGDCSAPAMRSGPAPADAARAEPAGPGGAPAARHPFAALAALRAGTAGGPDGRGAGEGVDGQVEGEGAGGEGDRGPGRPTRPARPRR